MNDQEVLFKGMKYCNNHYDKKIRCQKCPLNHRVCIDYKGQIALPDGIGHLSYVKFTEYFREMINILCEDELP